MDKSTSDRSSEPSLGCLILTLNYVCEVFYAFCNLYIEFSVDLVSIDAQMMFERDLDHLSLDPGPSFLPKIRDK